jgi:translocation and assembly module TamB
VALVDRTGSNGMFRESRMMAPAVATRRRWIWIGGLFLASGATLLATLPWLASTPPVRRWIVAKANRMLAPSRIEVGSLRFSWFGPIRASAVVFRDRNGKALLSVPQARLDRGLVPLAIARPIRGVLTLEGAALDIERRPDGSLDLAEALSSATDSASKPELPATTSPPALSGPGPDLTIKVVGGSLRVAAPELLEPLVARRMDVTLHLPSASGPLTAKVSLAEPIEGEDATLDLEGEFDIRASNAGAADLSATLSGKNWPWAVKTSSVTALGRLDGQLSAKRRAGLWTVSGNPSLLGLEASGKSLGGDRLRLDRLSAVCDAAQTGEAWDVRRLDLGSPVATVQAHGLLSSTPAPGQSAQLDARLDLAALVRMMPRALRLRDGLALQSGVARLTLALGNGTEAEGRQFSLDARISDLVAKDGDREVAVREPATLATRVVQRGSELHLEQLAVKTGFLDASGSGDLVRGITLSASIDLEGLERQFHDLIDFGGVELAGKGRLAADFRPREGKTFLGRVAAEVRSLRVKGLTSSPIDRQRVRIDAGATGPADDAGWPQAWSFAQFSLQSDDVNAAATLTSKPPESSIQIHEIRADIQVPPAPGMTAPERVRLALTGQFDPVRGSLDLLAKPGTTPEPVALGPEGLHVIGLNQGGPVDVALGLVGDAAHLDRVLAAWSGSAANGLAGALSVKAGAKIAPDGALSVGVAFQSPDLTQPGAGGTTRRPVGPVALGIQARKPAGADRIDLEQLALGCRYAQINAKGHLDRPADRRLADLSGEIVPNWPAVNALIAQSVEPRAAIKGQMRPFRLKGPLTGANIAAILQGLDAELAVDQFEGFVFGLRVAPTPVVVRCGNGQVTIDPIETTINDGPTNLRPVVELDPTQGSITLRLAKGSAVNGVAINDEVSRGLLSYIAPVLHDATSVKGKVSASIDQAEFPIVSNGQGSTTVVGKVVFDQVEFDTGPSASELLGLVGRNGPQALRLQEPIQLAIANGRVNESGLSVALTHDVRIDFQGSIGFDQTVAMVARVPVTPKMLGPELGLDKVLGGQGAVRVPIGGTLSRPTIDQKAFRVGLRDVGKSLLKGGGEKQVRDLLKGFVLPEVPR